METLIKRQSMEKDILLGRKETVGVTAKDNRLFIESVIYRYKTGILWVIC